jgi:hypothetical protein
MVTGRCDRGAVDRGVADLGGAVDEGGALEDRGALEDGGALDDGGMLEACAALEDGGVVSGGGVVLLVLATGAACGCGVTPDSPAVVLQPVITTTTPAIQASSKRIRITHLAESSIGDPPPLAEGSFGRISPNPRTCVFA